MRSNLLTSLRRRLATRLPGSRLGVGSLAHPDWRQPGVGPWAPLASTESRQCNICRWSGDRFEGPAHCEAALCPGCGSIARDRFLFWALQQCIVAPDTAQRLRLLETSPRMDATYRQAMATWFDYLCSDFDERAHAIRG